MFRFLSLISLASISGFLAGSFVPVAAAEADYPIREAVECRVRGGIPNLMKKLQESDGGEIRVGYLGGSITAAPGWRVKSLKWLQERYPGSRFEEIHAAIGGTGSDLGVFRMERDVLRHSPDLLFVEFAVNDGGAPPERIVQAMEGIVRQTWEANPQTDIIFVYTLSQPFLEELQAGHFSRSASAMEAVADHYAIPTIHLGVETAAMEQAGSLIFKGEKPTGDADPGSPIVFSVDGVHPLVETGHQLYLDAIARSWETLESSWEGEAVPHLPGNPLRQDHWAAARMVSLSESMLEGKWTKLDGSEGGDPVARKFARLMPGMWRADAPGATLRFRFRGKMAGLFDVVGPDGGELMVSVTGEEPRSVRRIDGYCTYHRLSKFSVVSGLDSEAKVREVSVTLEGTTLDKEAILFERNRADLEAHPDKYAGHVWHAGAIMLIGELVE